MTTSRRALSTPPRPSTSSSPTSRTYFPALDGIRAAAFLMVFATHYLQLPWGWTGVNVFFVLSGFLITGILYDTRDQRGGIANFYLRRTLRIFPLYYGVMLALLLAWPIFRWQWNWHWLIWPAYLGNMARLLQPGAPGSPTATLEFAQLTSATFPRVQLYFGHFWSLCVEEQFYLIWPWIVFAFRSPVSSPRSRARLIVLCVTGIVVFPALRILAGHAIPAARLDDAVFLSVTPLPFDALLIGALIALVRRGPRAAAVLPAARIGFVILIAAFLIALAVPSPHSASASYTYPHGAFTWRLTLIDLFFACVLVLALEPGSLTFRLFHLRPLRWLGRISYGAYVFHDILHTQILRLFEHYSIHSTLPPAVLAFTLTLLLAWASFRWFESPFIRLKDHWSAGVAPNCETPQQAAHERIRHVA